MPFSSVTIVDFEQVIVCWAIFYFELDLISGIIAGLNSTLQTLD